MCEIVSVHSAQAEVERELQALALLGVVVLGAGGDARAQLAHEGAERGGLGGERIEVEGGLGLVAQVEQGQGARGGGVARA